MILGKLAGAALAPVLGMVLVLTSTAQAANVSAASFLAGCPGPIFVSTDTTLVGSATVAGDCTVSTATGATPGAQINLSGARLTFTGFFRILGNASSMTVDKSRITTGTDLVLDSFGLMTIAGSTLTVGGSLDLPPRDSLAINESHITASGGVTVGGVGGLRNITDSTITAGGPITIAPGEISVSGVPSQINVLGSTLTAGSITVGGRAATQTISGSTLKGTGTGTAVLLSGFTSGARLISEDTITAAAGSVSFEGSGILLVEDTKVTSGAGPGIDASIRVANGAAGATGATFVRTQFRSMLGTMSFTGTGSHMFVGGTMLAGGVDPSGRGIQFASGSGKSMIQTTIQANAGDIRLDGAGDFAIMGSSLSAKGTHGITLSNASNRTIIDSKLDAPHGPITIVGFGDTQIVASTLGARNAGGMLLTGAGSSEINASTLTTLGQISIPNGGGSTIAASKLQASDGFITETGSGDSNLFASQVTASSITVRSFQHTTVTDNTLKATTFEFSSTGTCTSTSNTPNIPCF